MTAPTFAEACPFDDGSLGLTLGMFGQRGVWFGSTLIDTVPLRFPAGVTTADGRRWVVATGQNAGAGAGVWVVREDGVVMQISPSNFGARAIIQAATTGTACVGVAWTDSASAWMAATVLFPGLAELGPSGVIADGSGANGMRDWNGVQPLPMSPLDGPLVGYQCRAATADAAQAVTLACAIDPRLPGQVVIARGGALGTLNLPGCDYWQTLRVSPNGQWYSFTNLAAKQIVHGALPPPLPPPLPPLVTQPAAPLPDVSAVVPLPAGAWVVDFCFNDAPTGGNATIPVRPTVPVDGDVIL